MAEYEAQGDGWTFNDASGRIDDDHPIVEATEASATLAMRDTPQCELKIRRCAGLAVLFQRQVYVLGMMQVSQESVEVESGLAAFASVLHAASKQRLRRRRQAARTQPSSALGGVQF